MGVGSFFGETTAEKLCFAGEYDAPLLEYDPNNYVGICTQFMSNLFLDCVAMTHRMKKLAEFLTGKFVHDHVIGYLSQYLDQYGTDREMGGTFTLWQSNIAHEASWTRVTRMDHDLALTLRRYAASVDNFAVVMMGDHGLGYGQAATTT